MFRALDTELWEDRADKKVAQLSNKVSHSLGMGFFGCMQYCAANSNTNIQTQCLFQVLFGELTCYVWHGE